MGSRCFKKSTQRCAKALVASILSECPGDLASAQLMACMARGACSDGGFGPPCEDSELHVFWDEFATVALGMALTLFPLRPSCLASMFDGIKKIGVVL